ncbi:MAG: YciK family oxidoreductase [Gammaproteobacteria bacterium]|nr:YciK family oxidoreductase [Gammaproteobacteria bacterium]MDH5652115.1 YciK family oxidoreductase [Gammaproteobacteria bacterium]
MSSIHTYQPTTDCLQDRIILITGAGAGIGAAVAKSCASHGATVILLGKTTRKLETVYDEIVASGAPEPIIMPMDLAVAKPEDYTNMAEAVEKEFGHLDGLLHNAAHLGNRMMFEQYDLELWNKVMQVNLNAPMLLTRACLPLLKKSADASIIFTSSESGRKGRAYWGAYAISNAATDNMMQVLADELETNTGIRVNSLDPGPVRSALRLIAYPGENQNQIKKPEEIVNGYLYLLGPAGKGVTGQLLSLQA